MSRFVRLVPGVWICATISLLCLLIVNGHDPSLPGKYFRSMFFVPMVPWHVDGIQDIWVSITYWTLFVEISFYGLIAILLAKHQFHRIGQVATCLGAVTCGFWLLWFACYVSLPLEWHETLIEISYKRYFDLSLVTHGAFFGLGVNLWLCLIKKVESRPVSIWICGFGGALDTFHTAVSAGRSPWAELFVAAAGIALVVISIYAQGILRGPVKLARLTGLTAYPLYLIHIPLGMMLMSLEAKVGVTAIPAALIAMVVCVTVSALLARFAEPPLQRLIRLVFERGRRQPASVPA